MQADQSSPEGRSGAGIGVGMLRARGFSVSFLVGFLVSWSLVSWFGFVISWFLEVLAVSVLVFDFLVFVYLLSRLLGFLVFDFLISKILGFLASCFQRFLVLLGSMFQRFTAFPFHVF